MKSYEALQAAIDRNTIEHARALHKSASLVHKYQEPALDWTDSGSHNPLDRIETIIQTSLNLGTPAGKALAPIQYLAERFGLVIIPIPKTTPCTKTLSQELIKTISEFSELARTASIALEDGIITKRESAEISREGWELVRQVAEFVQVIGESAK